MKIATWNVNSLNVRLQQELEWLDAAKPDVLVLQEIKQVTEAFPAETFAEIGYHGVANGQKTYNGVAVLSLTESADHVTGSSQRRRDSVLCLLGTTTTDIGNERKRNIMHTALAA